MSKTKSIFPWGGLSAALILASFLALFGCTRGYFFDDSRIPVAGLPTILIVDPADGARTVPVNAKICVLFSDRMDETSVAKGLKIRAGGTNFAVRADALRVLDGGRLFVYDDASLVFPENAEVVVTIGTAVMDLDGYHMAKEAVSRFATSNVVDSSPPSISESVPVERAVVSLDSAVSLEFNDAMLRGTVERSFQLRSMNAKDPDPPRDYRNGRFSWDGRTVRYIPNEPLKMHDAEYVVSLSNNKIACMDIAGNAFPDGSPSPVINFYTISEHVVYVSSTGSDDNEGTARYSPKATISEAVGAAEANHFDVIKVAVGTYVDTVSLRGSGSDGIGIYGGYPADFGSESRTPGTRVRAPSSVDHAFEISGASDIVIDGLEIRGPANAPAGSSAVSIGDCRDIAIRNCDIAGPEVAGTGESFGIRVANSNGVRISCNIVTGGNGGTATTGISVSGGGLETSISGNSLIEGNSKGAFAGVATGVALVDTEASVTRNAVIRGGNWPRNVGVSISGGSGLAVVADNELIEGGSAGEVVGIEVRDRASPTIRDNRKVTGGSTATGDGWGIRVSGGSVISLFRNLINGGTVTSVNGTARGIGFVFSAGQSVSTIRAFNNFIAGGTQSCSSSVRSQGVFSNAMDVPLLVLNNTIDGGGKTGGGSYDSYGIFIDGMTTGINESPVFINNYIIPGGGGVTCGLFVLSSSHPLPSILFNNVFNNHITGLNRYIAGTGYGNVGTIDGLNGSLGAQFFDPAPMGNRIDSNPPVNVFREYAAGDYHLHPSSASTVANLGYAGTGIVPASGLYSDENALVDIDGASRVVLDGYGNLDYSLVDLGADEVH